MVVWIRDFAGYWIICFLSQSKLKIAERIAHNTE